MLNIRTFIAIEFKEPIKEYLWEQLQSLKEYILKGNFTSQENFHLTLNFLGEVTPNQIDVLKEALNFSVSKLQPFTLILDRLREFRRGNKSTLWIGINKSADLEALFLSLKNKLRLCGFIMEERGFNPHITLGREVVFKVAFEQLYRKIDIHPKEIYVDRISLMESTRIEGKLKYIPIYTKNF